MRRDGLRGNEELNLKEISDCWLECQCKTSTAGQQQLQAWSVQDCHLPAVPAICFGVYIYMSL